MMIMTQMYTINTIEYQKSQDSFCTDSDGEGMVMTGASNFTPVWSVLKRGAGGIVYTPIQTQTEEAKEIFAEKTVQNLSTAATYAQGRKSCKTNIGSRSFDGKLWTVSAKKDQETFDALQAKQKITTKSIFF